MVKEFLKEVIFPTIYFENPGPENTERTLAIARERAIELGIKSILVASTSGRTGVKAAQLFQNFDLIVVTHSTGFSSPGVQELKPRNREKILTLKGKILTCQHAFGGIGRAVRKKFGTYELEEIVANTLRLFGQGVKVACEIVLMAADAGLISTNEEVISIGGTDSGADTALVIKPTNAQTFFDLWILEILCKPHFK